MPTYTSTIPQPGDYPSQSQNLILENFEVLQTGFSQDHGPYNAPNQGQHYQITFPVGPLTGQPFTYLTGQIGLQSINQAPTSVPDIWMTRGTGTAYPITGYAINGTAKSGWTYLPSGVLYAWGYAAITSGGTVTITYISADTSGGAGTNFPGFVTMGNPNITQISAASAVTLSVSAYSATTFTVYSSTGANANFIWSAIGI